MLAVAARCTALDQGGANAEWLSSGFSMTIPPSIINEIRFSICQISVGIPLSHRQCVCAAQKVDSIEVLVLLVQKPSTLLFEVSP